MKLPPLIVSQELGFILPAFYMLSYKHVEQLDCIGTANRIIAAWQSNSFWKTRLSKCTR